VKGWTQECEGRYTKAVSDGYQLEVLMRDRGGTVIVRHPNKGLTSVTLPYGEFGHLFTAVSSLLEVMKEKPECPIEP
jgi:hypothetical protein